MFFDWNNPKEPKGINHAALSGQIINSTKYYDMYYYAHTSDKNGKRYLNGKRKYTSIKDVYNNNYYKNMCFKVGLYEKSIIHREYFCFISNFISNNFVCILQ